MTPIPSLPTDGPLAPCGPAAGAGMAVDDLKRQIFDATPMGLCLLLHGVPQLINARFAELLGANATDADRPAAWLQQQWQELWPQLQGIGRGQRHVSCTNQAAEVFNGRAYARALPVFTRERFE